MKSLGLTLLRWRLRLLACWALAGMAWPAGLMLAGRAAMKPFAWLVPVWTVALVVGFIVVRWQRERLVREGPLPQYPKRSLRQRHPQLTVKDSDLVERGARQFWLALLRSGNRPVAVPSRVVADWWRAFAAQPDAYRDWCKLCLGRVPRPEEPATLGLDAKRNDALRRTWYWACKDEGLDARAATRLPLLFALDLKLNITGGLRYALSNALAPKPSDDADSGEGGWYFGSDFGDDAYSGDAAAFGGADASSSDGGDGGGGDGGGGDGGGGD